MPDNRRQNLEIIFQKTDVKRQKSNGSVYFVILFSVFCLLFSGYCEPASLKIHFLDVGEGDSILIQTPASETVLVDTGNLITGLNIVNYLEKNNIYELDHLIFTHPHLDHIGGAFFILPMIEVINVYDNGQDLSKKIQDEDIYRWYNDLVRRSDKYSILGVGDDLLSGEVKLKILWPNRPFASSDFNVNSLVIMVEYKAFRCLLVGDLTALAEAELLEKKSSLKADILKVGHHGSGDASSQRFLSAVSPRIAIISVNKDNIRGYPSSEALKRLEKIGTRIYRTDRDGNIMATVGDNGKVRLKVKNDF